MDSFLLREVLSFCHEISLILKSKWRDLNSRLGGCGIYVSEIYFSNFLKNKEEKDRSDPQPNSMIQPKARGLLHMEREYFAHHIWSRFQGMSTSQPRSKWKYLKDYSTYLIEEPESTRKMFRPLEVLEDAPSSTRRLQDSATKSSGLVRPGVAGLLIGVECSRVRDSSWMYLTSLVNYPNRRRTSCSTKETTRSCCSRTPTVLG